MLPRLMPDLLDMPMSLGEHLHELRRRLVLPIAVLIAAFIAAVSFHNELKEVVVWPLRRALQLLDPAVLARLGLDADSYRLLTPFTLGESTLLSMQVAFDAAIAVTIPVLLYQLWMFVAVGLKAEERRLAFLFVPLGAILFYVGAVVGYFWGLPFFYAWLLEWEANDSVARQYLIGMSQYHAFFINMTLCFGLIMDIPWAVMVLVRVGFVTTAKFASLRRYIALINLVLAAMITPTTDVFSLLAMFIPMQLLFEGGLLASRVMMWQKARREAPRA